MKINKRSIIIFLVILITFMLYIKIPSKAYATDSEGLTNTTRAYFCSEITAGYANGDCILLENYDENGNKIYGLIDAGRKLSKEDSDGNSSTVVKEYLKDHGVEKLEFLVITHEHGDHNGDALTVLENFEVDTIIIKEFDSTWSTDGSQSTYESIIEIAIDKGIRVLGVSYLSLTSEEISPNRSESFIDYVENADKSLFEGFYYNSDEDNNIIFSFGSSTIQIYNWEMFDEDGNQYITGVTTDTTREIDTNENNNSLVLLLTQGNKKALFTGDLNNLDEDEGTGRIGDEDRLKDEIGDIDFLKVAHHGCSGSNTEDFINSLNPEYAVITNDVGGAYRDIVNYLNENDVTYLYTTVDDYGVTATITSDEVYLGFETDGYKNINGEIVYIAEEDKYSDYTKVAYTIEYTDKTVSASSWSELEEIITNNTEIVNLDDTNRICTFYNLIINLKNSGDWTATSQITIESLQRVTLNTDKEITILRSTDLKDKPLFQIEGYLSIGTDKMTGTITLDGNKDNVEAKTTLIKIEDGTFELYDGVTLCNNINKTTSKTKDATYQDYTSFGSAIYCSNGTINMYGGKISDNSADVDNTFTLPKQINNYYRYSVLGVGIYLSNNSVFNMTGGEISDNVGNNHSVVTTNSTYTNSPRDRTVTQGVCGVGIYAYTNCTVNLSGGKISGNVANNDSVTTIAKGTDETVTTNIYSLNTCIYGVGVFSISSSVNITDGFEISNNTANLNNSITIEEETIVKNTVSDAVRGIEAYFTNTDVTIDEATISKGSYTSNIVNVNNGSIGSSGSGTISTTICGGGLDIISNSTFSIKNLNVKDCYSEQGSGIYIYEADGTISDSNITDNMCSGNGGGIYIYNANVEIENTTIDSNTSKFGGGIYINSAKSNTSLNNVTITNNTTTEGSGGGIYAYGILEISGEKTKISNNTAYTAGGGIMSRAKTILNAGTISDNKALTTSGGGIRTIEGTLIVNGGTITDNSANKNGGRN